MDTFHYEIVEKKEIVKTAILMCKTEELLDYSFVLKGFIKFMVIYQIETQHL